MAIRNAGGSAKVKVRTLNELTGKWKRKCLETAQDTFWGGYAGYFQDPDGHLWEVAFNPQWRIEE